MTKHAAIFQSNRSQAVRIPKDFAFPEGLKKLVIRREGKSLVLTPVDDFWDEFFARGASDFPERLAQGDFETREPL